MITIRNYNGTIDELVKNTGNMHYDVTSLVLKKIADNIVNKAYITNNSKLRDISNYIYETKEHLDVAWNKYCKNKTDCSRHSGIILGFNGTYDELGQDISKASEKDIIILMDKFGDDFLRQADADWHRGEKGRKKLATELYAAANCMYKGRMET